MFHKFFDENSILEQIIFFQYFFQFFSFFNLTCMNLILNIFS